MIKQAFISLISAAVAITSFAQIVTYDNTATFSGSGVTNGGVTAGAGTTRYTYMVADDLSYDPLNALTPVNLFKFTVANFNTSSLSIAPTINFYNNDGTAGGPGTLIASFNFNNVSVAAGSVSLFTYSVPLTQQFLLPVTGTVWAGIYFSSSTLTAAMMNNAGQGTYNPPSVGSSMDEDFVSSGVGPFTTSNPAGTIRTSPYSGSPVASYGWHIETLAVVPEPSTVALMGGASILGASFYLRRRNRMR